MIIELKIKKSWFYGAGSDKVYGWARYGFHQWGVGINKDLLKDGDTIRIRIDGLYYELDCTEAINFCSHFNSFKKQKGTILAVVSRSLLKPII